MKLNPNVIDVWAFSREADIAKFLVLRTSVEKANKHFNGVQFWQIPSAFLEDNEGPASGVKRELAAFGLEPTAIWAVEHAYTFYNVRYEEVQIATVFAAEVVTPSTLTLGPGHCEAKWLTASEAESLVTYRGLKEGVQWADKYITGRAEPHGEFKLPGV